MKTLRLISVLVFTAAASLSTLAQTNYYPNPPGTLIVNDSTYKYDLEFNGTEIIFYNSNNRFTYSKMANRDGSALSYEVYEGKTLENDNWTCPKAYAIVNNAFSAQQKAMVKGKHIMIDMKIDPNTGKVAEVQFEFSVASPYINIPPSVYVKIAQDLKRELWFVATPVGKKLHYCLLAWPQEPK